MEESVAQGELPQENLSFEDYLEISRRGEVVIGKAMASGKLNKQKEERKLSPKLIMLSRVLVISSTAMNVVALTFVASKLYSLLEVSPYLGVGVILAIAVVLLNLLAASWDAVRFPDFDVKDVFYIPKTAVWANRISELFFLCSLIAAPLFVFDVLPLYSYVLIVTIWFVHKSCASLFFKLRKENI